MSVLRGWVRTPVAELCVASQVDMTPTAGPAAHPTTTAAERPAGAPADEFLRRFSLGSFLEQVTSAVVVLDSADTVVAANAAARALNAGAAAVSVNRPAGGIIKACVDRARLRAPGGGYLAFENFFAGKWYLVQCYALGDQAGSDGRPYTLLSLTDITDRKHREFEMLENMAGLEEATRIAQMGTFKIDRKRNKVEWSPHMYIVHGVTLERFKPSIGNYATLVYPEDRETVARQMGWTDETRGDGGFEYRIVRPDGALRWVYLDRRILFDTDGQPYGLFGTVQDITESKQREQELQRLLRRNAILYEGLEVSPIGVAVLSMDDDRPSFIYVNAAFQDTTLHTVDTLNPQGLAALSPDMSADPWRRIAAAVETSHSLSVELTCRKADGSEFPASIEIAPVRDHPGRPATAYVVNVRDLTADRQRAAALLQSQKMEALGQLSGGVAHEINNLLQPVIALSDLGQTVLSNDPEKAMRYLQVIGNSGRKARDIVRQVLTFARRDSPLLAEHDIVPLVEDAINLAHKGMPPGMDVALSVEIDAAMAVCSPTQVSQVVLNLVRNAVDAMNGQGVVNVSLRRRDLDTVAAAELGLAPGLWIELGVVDTGCGMSADTRSRVFEPFFTTKPVGKGTGLGLSVVYSIVTGWGGTVAIDSQVDVGTTVMLYIPSVSARMPEPRPADHKNARAEGI
ncbi:MAG: PAS domain S-box protein [Rhodospirillaceae bacterium]|nr:PAS domain S-box protein [Rhodospirillaceae bacterium]